MMTQANRHSALAGPPGYVFREGDVADVRRIGRMDTGEPVYSFRVKDYPVTRIGLIEGKRDG